jgi:hypothetical protein
MKPMIRLLFVLCVLSSAAWAQRFAVVTGNWEENIWASTSSGAAGSAAAPSLSDSVILKSGVVVTVTTPAAECKGISFADTSAHLSLFTNSILSVYGDFGLASIAHKVFLGWGGGARIRFAGDQVQTLRGWSTTGFSTSFNYLLIDKTGGKVATEGTNMRLGIGDTLDVLNGTFELGTTDDIESRTYSGTATSFVLLVRSGGTFNMVGSTSHIRRASNTTLEAKRVGKAVLFGLAYFRSTSTNGLNFLGMDVESGGQLVAASFSSTAAGNFNAGSVTVKSGGELRVVSAVNFWDSTTASVVLQEGGVYRVNAADPVNAFPRTFGNNGKIRYGLTGDQIIKNMNYRRLEISFTGTKTWTLDSNRTIPDSIEINNSSTFKLTAASSKTITVNGTIRLTSGIFDNSDSNVILIVGDNAIISRATGVILKEPQFVNVVNLRYTSSTQTVTTGPEVPSSPLKVKNLVLACPKGLNLFGDMTVNGSLQMDNGLLYLNDKNLIMSENSTVTGTPTESSMVIVNGTGILRYKMNTPVLLNFPVGDTTGGIRFLPAKLSFMAGTFANAAVVVRPVREKHPSNSSINHFLNNYWTVTQQGVSNYSCNVEFTYAEADVTGNDANLYLGQWNGSNWNGFNQADAAANLLTGTVTSFSDFTGGEKSAVSAAGQERITMAPAFYALHDNFPNPFNPATTIRFDLPKESYVTIDIFNIIGQKVITLVNETLSAGSHAVQWRANAGSGVYFYRIDAASVNGNDRYLKTHKMILTK